MTAVLATQKCVLSKYAFYGGKLNVAHASKYESGTFLSGSTICNYNAFRTFPISLDKRQIIQWSISSHSIIKSNFAEFKILFDLFSALSYYIRATNICSSLNFNFVVVCHSYKEPKWQLLPSKKILNYQKYVISMLYVTLLRLNVTATSCWRLLAFYSINTKYINIHSSNRM